jgi:hypothetical protein
MSYKYLCNFCDYSSSTNGVVNHILEKHSNRFEKPSLLKGINGDMMICLICSEKTKDPFNISCCFGCKKFWGRSNMTEKHKKECPKKKEHSDKCKEILESKLNFNSNESTNNQLSNSSNNSELITKIKNLEKKIKELEEDNNDYKEGKIKYDALSLVLIDYVDSYTREKIADVLDSEIEDVESTNKIDWYSELVTYRESTKKFA